MDIKATIEKIVRGTTEIISRESLEKKLIDSVQSTKKKRPLRVKAGILYKYAKTVSSASLGAVTDLL